MNDKITEIKKVMSEATPGPWYVKDDKRSGINIETENCHIAHLDAVGRLSNAQFIVNAPEYITYLLQQLEEQTKRAETAIKANTLLVMGNSDLISRTHELHALVDTQSEALKWYANENNYIVDKGEWGDYYPQQVLKDKGAFAREALSIN